MKYYFNNKKNKMLKLTVLLSLMILNTCSASSLVLINLLPMAPPMAPMPPPPPPGNDNSQIPLLVPASIAPIYFEDPYNELQKEFTICSKQCQKYTCINMCKIKLEGTELFKKAQQQASKWSNFNKAMLLLL